MKGLFWLTTLEVSVHGCLAPMPGGEHRAEEAHLLHGDWEAKREKQEEAGVPTSIPGHTLNNLTSFP
jgi:hypothetical protein